MKVKSIELKNYKAHKNFVATLNGNNSLIQGHKGTGKTSIRDGFYWVMTGTLIDDPTPVDAQGNIINHLTISVDVELMSGEKLKVESSQTFTKEGVLKTNHQMTFYINDTPYSKTDYLKYLESNYGTLEQRKILLDPTWFAYGNGLAVTGKTPKTATQRRREIVINAAGVSDIEQAISDNDNKSKQAKFALSRLKKEQDAAFAGVESLENAKIDVKHLDYDAIVNGIESLKTEEASSIASLEKLNSGNDVKNALERTLSDAQTRLSQERNLYMQQSNERLAVARKPYDDYVSKKQILDSKLQSALFAKSQQDQTKQNILTELEQLNKQRELKREEYILESSRVYNPTSTTCPTCSQALPVEQMVSAEARFNKNKSDLLERIQAQGVLISDKIKIKEKELAIPPKDFNIESIQEELYKLGQEPTVEYIPTFEETPIYKELVDAVNAAQANIESQNDDGTKQIYKNVIDNIRVQINEHQVLLGHFETNKHLEKQIESKGLELNEISANIDAQMTILDECKEFIRTTLNELDKKLEVVFDGIRFKMFEFTLDGEQKDTCIVYSKTNNGYIPWESLSGGQKRSATIKLANAFNKAWDKDMPLWIDDTQIYQEDEIAAIMQLVRITEVPNAQLEVK